MSEQKLDISDRLWLAYKVCAGIEDHHLEKILEVGGFSQMVTAKLVRQNEYLLENLKMAQLWFSQTAHQGAAVLNKVIASIESNASMDWSVPEGWKLVPILPTHAMTIAGMKDVQGLQYVQSNEANQIYASMIAAAPKPEDK